MKQPINEIKKMQRLAGIITESEYRESLVNENSDTVTIELYQGTKLIGPKENEVAAKKLAKEIEQAMKSAFKAAKGSGSESDTMDERDDAVYKFEDELKKLGFKID